MDFCGVECVEMLKDMLKDVESIFNTLLTNSISRHDIIIAEGMQTADPKRKDGYKMNGAKMSKKFFFEMIEKELEELTEEVKEIKADAELDHYERAAKENILFGKLLELNNINFYARDVDYWRYTELDKKIREVRKMI